VIPFPSLAQTDSADGALVEHETPTSQRRSVVAKHAPIDGVPSRVPLKPLAASRPRGPSGPRKCAVRPHGVT